MEKQSKKSIFVNPLMKENPILILILGMCPVLGTSTTIDNAIGMGAAVIVVLFFTNLFISLIRKWVPNEIRIPVYIVIIACFVTMVEQLMNAFTPALSQSLGAFIPMITVNCVILGRAEAFASKNTVGDSIIDAFGSGLGFLIALFIVAFFREFLATGGLVLSNPFTNDVIFSVHPLEQFAIPLIGQNVGAFLILGLTLGVVTTIRFARQDKVALKVAKEVK